MRHGVTHYTEVFPDLAEEGIPFLKSTARRIARDFPKNPVFISSPSPRTLATVLHVMEAYGLEPQLEAIHQEPLIGPIALHVPEAVLSFLKQAIAPLGDMSNDPLRRHQILDHLYLENPFFENGIFCESRGESFERLRQFLPKLREHCRPDRHVVVTTHLDVMGGFIQEQFGESDNPFPPGEVLHITFLTPSKAQLTLRGDTRIANL